MQPENSLPIPIVNTLSSFQIHHFHSLLTHPLHINKAFFPFADIPYPVSREKVAEDHHIRGFTQDIAVNVRQKQERETKTVKKGSIYHNFQKHLVTTLRINIHLPNEKQDTSSVQRLAGQLWQYFIKSRKPTKKFLYGLLNSAPSDIDQENKLKKNYDHIDFQAIAEDISLEQLKEAQIYLRLEIVKQSKQLMESGLLLGRRMLKVQEFEEYFQTFINDVQSDDLTLRLSKKKLKAKQVEGHQDSKIHQEKGEI